MILEMKWTAQDYLDALDMLQRASLRIAGHYSSSMTRDEAKAHFDARSLLAKHRFITQDEAESIFLPAKTKQAVRH